MTAALTLDTFMPPEFGQRTGRVTRVTPTYLEATGPRQVRGSLCRIGQDEPILAEVVGCDTSRVTLMPLEHGAPIAPGARVSAVSDHPIGQVGSALSGMMVDALGRALEPAQFSKCLETAPLDRAAPCPSERARLDTALATGVIAIDALTTLARGQRVGVFAASGVGKTTLMRQIARHVVCDRLVLCLVGERGREASDFWAEVKAPHATCVTATSDQSAPLRARAVLQALAIAEYWRDRGEHVVLIMDSVTRYAMALREMGLAAGEPPTLRAYTPNVFAELPRVVERCGAVTSGGAITAIFTILSETDDAEDPITEVMKSILDGHIILSRELAERGHYPAIDVLRSVSRCFDAVTTDKHRAAATWARRRLADHESARLLLESGMYRPGVAQETDLAIAAAKTINALLTEASKTKAPASSQLEALMAAEGSA